MSEMGSSSQSDRNEFLRTEYTALTTYFGTVTTFRFTTMSFFIAAMAFVVQKDTDLKWFHYVLLLLITFGAWVVELRNRSLSYNLENRAKEIEAEWRTAQPKIPAEEPAVGDSSEKPVIAPAPGNPFFMHMISAEDDKPYEDKTRLIFRRRPFHCWFITHANGLDLIYLSALLYSFCGVIQNLCHCLPKWLL